MIIHYYYRRAHGVMTRFKHEWRDLEQIWFRAEKSVICE